MMVIIDLTTPDENKFIICFVFSQIVHIVSYNYTIYFVDWLKLYIKLFSCDGRQGRCIVGTEMHCG